MIPGVWKDPSESRCGSRNWLEILLGLVCVFWCWVPGSYQVWPCHEHLNSWKNLEASNTLHCTALVCRAWRVWRRHQMSNTYPPPPSCSTKSVRNRHTNTPRYPNNSSRSMPLIVPTNMVCLSSRARWKTNCIVQLIRIFPGVPFLEENTTHRRNTIDRDKVGFEWTGWDKGGLNIIK